jgi:sRNA-binding protein
MASQYRIERDRGSKESRQQLAVLREKWPLAFPLKHQEVRPLAIGAAGEIAVVMGWPLPYTLGVLGRWKMAAVYCQAILCYGQRIGVDGATAEAVDAEAKRLAAKQLVQLATREESGRGARRGEAEGCPGTANQDAGAITRTGACSAVAPARLAARKTA